MSLLRDNTTPASRVESRLSELRKRRGIAAAELARAAGVSRQTIYAMEAGDYIPNTAVALKLARILQSTAEDLFRLAAGPPPWGRRVRPHSGGRANARAHPAELGGGSLPARPLPARRGAGSARAT